MKKRVIALSVASIMSAQSIAFAQAADRTAGIGNAAVAEAQQNLKNVQGDLLKLDQSLEQIAKAIETRDDKGSIAGGLAVTGSVIGVGLSAFAFFAMKSRHGEGGGGIVGAFIGLIGLASSVAGGAAGFIGTAQKNDVSTEELAKEISSLQGLVKTELVQTQDKASRGLLANLESSLNGLQESVAAYKKDDTGTSRNLLASHIAQVAGAALTVFGMTQKQDRITAIGAMIMTAGNIARISEGLSDSKAEEVLKEIEKTRATVRTAAQSLN